MFDGQVTGVDLVRVLCKQSHDDGHHVGRKEVDDGRFVLSGLGGSNCCHPSFRLLTLALSSTKPMTFRVLFTFLEEEGVSSVELKLCSCEMGSTLR